MRRNVNVLVIEDNDYYNDLLVRNLKTAIKEADPAKLCNVIIHPFSDSGECVCRIKTGAFDKGDLIAFVDYYLGNGITGSHIIRILRKHNRSGHFIMLSKSTAVSERDQQGEADFFILKDTHAPALCRLYLEQFIENKIS